ncbi:TRAP transporter small permease [Arcanobacterium hippocoleae]|uniref:TRAP-type C4-dicarboxylate transport system permease small subunit n=1 Tax=Arcanobacterium hippocoleae TaxID=149017 RepID=A0ABU1T3R6_9ACTO|nr:TRAP transporter small permease [Arcanobacterium hippocoleae]MDR6940029.1 TRAP-type C4-dicarboxylate transport system permease small subunit [Arcanobacterium hippocoleae]
MQKIFQATDRVLGFLCIILFSLLVFTTTWQVFSRLILNSPVTWSEELAKILFVWLSFLGLAYVYGERGHMAVEFLARKFSAKLERALALWTHLIAFVLAIVVFIWGGLNAAINAWSQNLTALPVTIGSAYLVIPISGVAIALYAIYHLIEIATGKETNYPIPDAAENIANDVAIATEKTGAIAPASTQDVQKGSVR